MMVRTILIIDDNLIRLYSFSIVIGFSIGKALVIIPIDIEIFFLLRPEKPPLFIESAGAFSFKIQGKVIFFYLFFHK